MSGGPGGDTFTWNPGHGNDTISGDTGSDAVVFDGSSIAETVQIVAEGTGFDLSRDVSNVTLDVDGVER